MVIINLILSIGPSIVPFSFLSLVMRSYGSSTDSDDLPEQR